MKLHSDGYYRVTAETVKGAVLHRDHDHIIDALKTYSMFMENAYNNDLQGAEVGIVDMEAGKRIITHTVEGKYDADS